MADTDPKPPPWQLQLPERAAVFTGELTRPGRWTVANIETGIPWPVKAQTIAYRGEDYWIIPPTEDTGPAVALRLSQDEGTDAHTKVMRFLSALSWIMDGSIRVSGFSGGGMPHLSSRPGRRGYGLTADFFIHDLPEPDAQGQLALALMREARSLDHAAYSFLTFYRVLEAAMPDGRRRGPWLDGALPCLRGQAKEALDKLTAQGVTDVGERIRNERRQAIAHASAQPIIDPDDYSLVRQLHQELPMIQGLAVLAVEDFFGIKTRSTIYSEHLYELAGFRELFPVDLMTLIMQGPWEGTNGEIDLPSIDVELRRSEPFAALRGLLPIRADLGEAKLRVHYASADGLVSFTVELHFTDERLVFDVEAGLRAADNGSSQAASNVVDLLRFKLDYLNNGELNLYDAETRALLSRVDAFMPINCWANHEWFASEIAKWQGLAARRAEGAPSANNADALPNA